MKIKYFCLIILIFSLYHNNVEAQRENRFIRKGTEEYESNKFNEAEIDFRKALEKNPSSAVSQYNLGNSLYKQNNFEESVKAWSHLANRSDLSPQTSAHIWHNMGNAFMKSKKYNEAIEAYKNALRLNPKDDDTRYNLSYALRMAKKQEHQQNQQQNQQEQEQQKQPQPQPQQSQQQPEQQPQQGQPQEISKQDAERMLEAMKNAEQKTMEKLKKEKKALVTEKSDKDW